VKAFLLSVDGQKTLALWTTKVEARRPLRLRLGVSRVTLENPYDVQTSVTPAAGVLTVTATYLPTYVRGVGAQAAALPATTLTASGFNLPGQPISATARFFNDGTSPLPLTADFYAPPGYSVAPPHLSHTLAPGEHYEPSVTLQGAGGPAGNLRVGADLGGEKITRVAAFALNEGAGAIPFTAAPPSLDAGPQPWEALGPAALLGTIAGPDQFAAGDKSAWKGPSDLSAKIYAAWTRDAVEVCLDGRGAAFQYQKEPTEGVYQVGVGAPGAGNVRVISKTPLAGLQTATRRTPGGYFVSVRVPLTAQNFPAGDLRAGRPLKLSVLVNDKDDPKATARKNVFGWHFSPNGANYVDTSGWKTLLLSKP